MMYIILPVLLLGGLSVLFGVILAYASKKFAVEVDPKIEQIIEALPGANCGSCGFAGCGGYADAIVNSGADVAGCAPGGPETAKKIAQIMGVVAEIKEKHIAVIHCQSGGINNTFYRYNYKGIKTCKSAVLLSSGPNICSWGCVFQFDCVEACKFGALKVDKKTGLRVVNEKKCTGCGACVKACPRNLIELVPASKNVQILCSSQDKGALAKASCGNKTACIGCGMCAKKCPVEAITLKNNLAIIDYNKCINCGMCASVCPTKAIIDHKAPRKRAFINEDLCIGCTICAKKCPVEAISGELKGKHSVDKDKCVGCEICVEKCPKKAIVMQ